jgi:phosphinothricin acetyltransferase
MAGRLKAVTDRSLPYLVAEVDGEVAALAYAAPFRLRAAYRYTVEDSVYVAPAFKGRGIGKAVLTRVIEACEALGLRQMMAVIGDSENEGSIGLHRALGFEMKGTMPAVGFKHDRWVDIVLMQRALNGGAGSPPDAAGLQLSGH